jgi:nitroimidazol reductase NimA-like FMN-containing flavoprotein (pyridoxamine 5'-phosphate oxidase superfamily)
VRRLPERGRYDRTSIDAVLDTALVGHVRYVVDGQPFVTPTAIWRTGERLFGHGSAASRMLRVTVRLGPPIVDPGNAGPASPPSIGSWSGGG